jgi:hypothetical protein
MGYLVAYRRVAHFHDMALIGMARLVGQGDKVEPTGSSTLLLRVKQSR